MIIIISSILLLLDIMEYTEANDIPGEIFYLSIQKAFYIVSHQYLLEGLHWLGGNLWRSLLAIHCGKK